MRGRGMSAAGQIRVLVADDEPLSLALAADTIEVDPRLAVAARCPDGQSVIDALRATPVDVIVLDIRMPQVDGLDLARVLARDPEAPEIVFATAYGEHALEAFELGVCDYVAKPYDADRLRRAIFRAATRRQAKRPAHIVRPVERLLVRSRGAGHILEFGEIQAVDADEKEVWLHVGDRRFRYSSTISAIERILPCPPFVRIHRSHIVNLDHVKLLDDASNGTGTVLLTSGAAAPISRRYRRRLYALFLASR
jgi:DNA-binding LytR/AlgR family response regulator